MRGCEHAGMRVAVASIAAAMFQTPAAPAAINVELRPVSESVSLGETVEIGLYVVSDDETDQLLSAAQVILGWESTQLQLLGHHGVGAVALLSSGFPEGDPFGLNEVVPPQDGNGIYIAFAPIAGSVAATPDGALLTTFEFLAIAPATATPVDVLASAGTPATETIVFDGTVPNLDVTGVLVGTVVEVLSCCPPDLNGDCFVGIEDFLALLAAWGTDPGGPPDLDGDGNVGIEDFLALLAAWGRCP
jgi:hypothetical protein